ncbi:amino-acid N-acetyltransferase [Kroppenstedtia sanguinis]|uniref:GNAT family N-acetyltransferase n=1 Tax=Kroppenstedtia sanguinis TaxID=1380684 RepID=UPI003D20A89D
MFTVRRAIPEDREAIRQLLQQAGVSEKGVDHHLENFLLVKEPEEGRNVGTAGLEIHGDRGVLRSFVIEKKAWNAKTAMELITVVLSFVQKMKLKEIYLLTGVSPHLFEYFGFQSVKWEELPEVIRDSVAGRVDPSEAIPMVFRRAVDESIK